MHNQDRKAPRTVRLKRETLRVLSTGDLSKVGGGFIMQDTVIVPTGHGFIMKDTVIIRTSG
jgi:hypothetical protein